MDAYETRSSRELQGDGFLLGFATPRSVVVRALAVQRAVAGEYADLLDKENTRWISEKI